MRGDDVMIATRAAGAARREERASEPNLIARRARPCRRRPRRRAARGGRAAHSAPSLGQGSRQWMRRVHGHSSSSSRPATRCDRHHRIPFSDGDKTMQGLAIAILTVLCLSVTTWFLAKDFVTCTVTSAGYTPVNGWYAAVGGAYVKRGRAVTFFPDVFAVFALRKESAGMTLSQIKGAWVLGSLQLKKALYASTPSDPDQHLYAPPPDEWKAVDPPAVDPPPAVVQCHGSLADSPPLPSGRETNIEQLFMRPVTSLLLVAICYYYYVLWAGRTDPAAVAFSYDAIVNKGEWWRMVTASFAHFDLWHLIFNAMGLYQFGDLEFSYGSVVFGYLNADLVFLTMAICLVVHHVAVFRFGREEFLYQQAVGFSCVLFAWMVAASVRMDKFCPVFFLPSLCFTTYGIPNPFGWSLPVNAGPLLLLVATKLIIPRSSFIGHMSGIVIGYPVAWNALDWLSPPLFLAVIAWGFVYTHSLLPWRFPGYTQAADLTEYASPLQLTKYAFVKATCWPLVALSLLAAGTFGWLAAVSRLTVAYLAWCAVPARRLEWLAETRPAYDGAVLLLGMAATAAGFAALYDVSNLSSAVAAADLLAGCGLSPAFVAVGMALLACLAATEAAACLALVVCMHDVPPCAAALGTYFRADEAALTRDVQLLGMAWLVRCLTGAPPQHEALPQQHVFERGPGHVLGGGHQAAQPTAVGGGDGDSASPLLVPAATPFPRLDVGKNVAPNGPNAGPIRV